MRLSLRVLPLLLLWTLGLYPLVLIAVDQVSPAAATRTAVWVGAALHWSLWRLALLLAGLAVLYPPFRAGLRLLLRRLLDRMRTDRGPFMRALAELRHVETAARHLEAGRAAMALGEAATAMPHLQRALELEPGNLAALHQLGLALLALGQPQHAIAPLQHVVAHDRGHAFGGALLALGQAQLRLRQHQDAAATLQAHAREHGGNRRSHFWLGRCLQALGDLAGARAAFAVAAQPPPARQRLDASEAFYRARARVRLWRRWS